jgi:hypothetical protein
MFLIVDPTWRIAVVLLLLCPSRIYEDQDSFFQYPASFTVQNLHTISHFAL